MLAVLVLAACRARGPGDPTPPSTVPITLLAPTGPAGATAVATDTPSADLSTATASTIPAVGGTPAGTAIIDSTPTVSATSSAGGSDKATFVADVTVPDGTTFTAGQAFVKTWQVKNAGTSTWTSSYSLVFVRGAQMGGPTSVPLSDTVSPGATANLSLSLTAPNTLGTYTGFWMLRNPAGQLFGISADANQPVYVKIAVGKVGSTPQPTGVPGALKVSAVTLSVDQASFTGACPRTFTFNGSITSAGAGNMSYGLEATSDKPGFVFNLPGPVSSTLSGPGPRTFSVSYQLQFTASVSGQIWLHILKPSDLISNKVSFSLTCQP